MSDDDRVRIAVQKAGRLREKSMSLLARCGLSFDGGDETLFRRCDNFPLDLMLLRDDDIPEYVVDGVCELGIVGQNVLEEKLLGRGQPNDAVGVLKALRFGACHLALAVPFDQAYEAPASLRGMRIATSYPQITRRFFAEHGVEAQIVEISGSVEIAPALHVADAICDLVSTGATLRSNGLKEVATVLSSQSVLVGTKRPVSPKKAFEISRLMQRIEGVLRAEQTKYIMMNAPRSSLDAIRQMLPGMEEPTIMPLGGSDDRIAIHAVSHEGVFWETMESLKEAGASSILVMPIEKII